MCLTKIVFNIEEQYIYFLSKETCDIYVTYDICYYKEIFKLHIIITTTFLK